MDTAPYPNDSLERLHDVEREILEVVDALCREHGVDYFIDGGTCLGAVRHGGFIPWDDDIDIGIPQDDYMRFIELARDHLPHGYSIHTSTDSKGYSALWAKVYKDGTRFIDANAKEAGCDQGIFIDVFPYCRLDADKDTANRQCGKARLAQVKSYLKHFSNPKIPKGLPARKLIEAGCKVIHHSVARFWSQKKLQAEMDHAFDTDNPGRLWACASYTDYGKFDEEILFPTKDIEFDGLCVRAPHNCNAFLSTEYGNYMQLPPLDERYTHAPLILDFGDGENAINCS